MKIADISKYQGVVNWEKAAKELDFCILRASIGRERDTRFAENAKGCKSNGIPFHAYHYLKASTTAEVVSEALCFFKAASPWEPLFYVADVEYGGIPKAQARAIVSAFLGELKRLGAAHTGIYVGHHLYKGFNLAVEEADYVWIPRYGQNSGEPETPPAYPCDLWQYTSMGRLAGVSGNVDLNKITGDKPLSWFIGQMEGDMSNTTNRAGIPFTSEHFVAFLESLLGQPYWYGTCAYKCRSSLLASKTRQYPSHYKDSRKATYEKHIAQKKVCADCIGAAKGYAWTDGGEGVIEAIGTDKSISNKYGSRCPDKGANGMFAYAKTKGMPWGAIGTIPEIPGIAVTTSGHVGYYVGNGWVIEFKGFNYGCVKTELKKGKWTHWYMLTFLDYGDSDVTAPVQPSTPDTPIKYTLGSRLLKKGSKGNDVAELQGILVKLGYDLGTFGDNRDGVDGDYGTMTERAVRKFQSVQQIQIDGKYGNVSHAALMGVLADLGALNPDDDEGDDTPTTPEDGGAQAPQGKRVEATGNSVNVRTGPGTAYKIITRINKGDAFPFVATAEAYGWHAMEINGKIGWISGKYAAVKD